MNKSKHKAQTPFATLYYRISRPEKKILPDVSKFILNLNKKELKCRTCGKVLELPEDFDRKVHFKVVDSFKARHAHLD